MRSVGCALAFCFFSVATPVPVAADGNQLLKLCAAAERTADGVKQSVLDDVDAIRCMSYLNGITDLNMMYQAGLNRPKPQTLFCLPDTNIKNAQAVHIVVKFLRAHPEQLHQSDIFLVAVALAEAFPCQK